jgi:ABC-type protease/lipase transport system fused ATPase/permease subunit
LYGSPSLVVLDEPNSNLDGHGETALLASLSEMKAQRASVIVVSHRPSVLEAMDKILVLKDGEIGEFGSRHDILWRLRANVAQRGDQPREVRPVAERESSTIAERELTASAALRSA